MKCIQCGAENDSKNKIRSCCYKCGAILPPEPEPKKPLPVPEAPKPKKKTGLMIGISVGAAVLLAVVILLVLHPWSGREEKSSDELLVGVWNGNMLSSNGTIEFDKDGHFIINSGELGYWKYNNDNSELMLTYGGQSIVLKWYGSLPSYCRETDVSESVGYLVLSNEPMIEKMGEALKPSLWYVTENGLYFGYQYDRYGNGNFEIQCEKLIRIK